MNQSRAARARNGESEERDLPALVADASETQALVAVRELGRRGLKVRPRALIPVHDGSIEALRARRPEFERLAAMALAPEDAVAAAVDKSATFAAAADIRLRVPGGCMVRSPGEVGDAVDEVGLPVVVKPVRSRVSDGQAGRRLRTIVTYLDRHDARPALRAARPALRAVRTGAARLHRTILSRE